MRRGIGGGRWFKGIESNILKQTGTGCGRELFGSHWPDLGGLVAVSRPWPDSDPLDSVTRSRLVVKRVTGTRLWLWEENARYKTQNRIYASSLLFSCAGGAAGAREHEAMGRTKCGGRMDMLTQNSPFLTLSLPVVVLHGRQTVLPLSFLK